MTADITIDQLPLRPELVGEEPYGAPQLDVPVCLNVNENPYSPSPELAAALGAAITERAAGFNRYPDREAIGLRTALAGYLGHGLTVDNIWCANGSNEVMTHLLQAFAGPDREVLTFSPTYSMYPEYARNTHSGYRTLPRRDDFTIDVDAAVADITVHQPAVVIITSPNNPTGTSTDLDTIRAIATAARGIVIIDEAYQEFARPGTPSAVTLLPEHGNLVVSRTMSKAFAFAGGRLGYLAAAPAVVDACRIVRLPYHLSVVTQTVAEVAVAHAEELLSRVADLREQRDRLVDWLRDQGLTVADSDANFVYFGTFDDRHAIWQSLLDQGVLIRETGPDGWLRVSAGTPEEMAAFRAALTTTLEP